MRNRATLPFAILLACSLATACGGRTNSKDNVEKALDQANIKTVDVDVDRDANIVHLKGTVKTMAERTRAEEVATAAVGTTGRVLNELTVEGMNAETAGDLDDEILDTLDRTIERDPVLKERDISFEVHNGAVTIKGDVRTAEEKARVGDIAKAAPGVKEVANALEIKNER